MKKIKIFNETIAKIAKINTFRELFNILETEIVPFFEVSYLDIFILDTRELEYNLEKHIARIEDAPKTAVNTKLGLKDPIVVHLLDEKRVILPKELNKNIEVALTEQRKKFLFSLRDELVELEAELCVPAFANDGLVGIFVSGKKISKEEFSLREIELFSWLAERSAKVIYEFNLIKKEVELFISSLSQIINSLEKKDPATKGHSDRVAQFSVVVGRKLSDQIKDIPYAETSLYYAAELHDVGKVKLPDNLLKKRGSLNKEQWIEMKKHPLESVKMIRPLEKWFGTTILDAVLYHHENYDGTGYPYGKKGSDINILARIIRVADSFDAMVTSRPYRKALTYHESFSELKKGRGTQFDPKVLDAFSEAYKEGLFKAIFFPQLQDEKEQDKSHP